MVAKAAKIEDRTRGNKAAARKAVRGKRKVAREKAELVGHVEKQDTSPRGADKEVTKNFMPKMNRTVNTLKKQMTAKKTCKYGVCQKKARTSSGRMRSANVKNIR